jgi:hypothetical protein
MTLLARKTANLVEIGGLIQGGQSRARETTTHLIPEGLNALRMAEPVNEFGTLV